MTRNRFSNPTVAHSKVYALSANQSRIIRVCLCLIFAIAVLAFFSSKAHAIGMMIPKDKSLPALAIKSHRVQIDINEQGAETTVDQVFINNTNRDLEAVYLFPLPPGAAPTDFALWINGKRVKGEVLDAANAKRIYRQIVMQMKDPGLLEYVGGNLFRASVYPVPRKGEQRVQIKYAQVIPYDAGVCAYTYPLKTDRASARTLEDFTVSAKIKSSIPIRSVYSPTHEVSVTRKDDYNVRAGFEEDAAVLDRDFSLYYTFSEKDVGISMLTHREKQDGYFLLLITPGADPSADTVLPKDVLFVLDTSGSMKGEKIVRAKEALSYCLSALGEKDRFNIVRFSDGIEPMSKILLDASKSNIENGLGFIKNLRAVGGTNINEALLTALTNTGDEKRPGIIVFITDGEPTVGETKIAGILENVNGKNQDNWRIFSFGVGTKINTHLLDKLSEQNNGTSAYVRPDEQIERQISSFFNKIEKPVLTDVTIDYGKGEVFDVFPKKMPDLFAGTQLVLIGRYKNNCETAAILEGWREGAKIGNAQDVSFPKKATGNSFIRQLWAKRKVGYLLDEIRLHGENTELVQEVTRLGREYGLVTPYTSYLVTEPKGRHGRNLDMEGAAIDQFDLDTNGLMPSLSSGGAKKSKDNARSRYRAMEKSLGSVSSMQEEAGATAVDASKAISELKNNERVGGQGGGNTRWAAGKTFVWKNGRYIDTNHKQTNKTLTIRYGSDAYFRLLELYPEARAFLALGEKVTFSLKPGTSIVISSDGEHSLPDGKIRNFLP